MASNSYPILFVRNLSYNVTGEEIYEVFGQFGVIRQIRLGNDADTKGTAFVVYETMQGAKQAIDKLNGFSVGGRYIVVGYYQPRMLAKRLETVKKITEAKKVEESGGEGEGDES